MVTLVVLFDFRKAFDAIEHESILAALVQLGFTKSDLQLIHSYITGRTQAVLDEDGTESDYMDTSSGFPQGSSRGPIFFLVIINFLPKILKFCKLCKL